MPDQSFFLPLPKVEIHSHLEGSITPITLYELAHKNNRESEFGQSLKACENLYKFTNFDGFLNSFSKANNFIKNSSDFDVILKNSVELLKKENYMYIEYFISMDTFIKKNIPLTALLDQLRECKKRYSNQDFMIGGFIIDFVRNYGPNNALAILYDLQPILDDYRDVILGISIGGDETNFPATPFREVFEKARSVKMRLKTTAHAGESTNAQSVWDTILNLRTDRIGHGLRSHESDDLIKHLRATQTPLEICPTSNLKTGLIKSLDQHPIRDYFDNGVYVTVNTDDPGFFNNSLSGELQLLQETFNFSNEELNAIILNAAKSCFLNELSKKELLEKLKIRLENFAIY